MQQESAHTYFCHLNRKLFDMHGHCIMYTVPHTISFETFTDSWWLVFELQTIG